MCLGLGRRNTREQDFENLPCESNVDHFNNSD